MLTPYRKVRKPQTRSLLPGPEPRAARKPTVRSRAEKQPDRKRPRADLAAAVRSGIVWLPNRLKAPDLSRPHPSSFETSLNSFGLPGNLSEWLFASGFWNTVASVAGSPFDQYEDDELPPEAIAKVTVVLDELVRDMRNGGITQGRFTYAWTQTGEPIEAQVNAQEALSALEGLRLFLHKAHEAGREVVFSL